ncbi:MAG: ABC transporter permease [Planctomycetes bacterium]|nr:ABC transporter permease [Planctomycetota bacterium]
MTVAIGPTFRLGVRGLLQHKLRAALTMLGVLFGVSSVVAMLAIGEGASWEAQEQIRQLGSTNILIQSIKPAEDKRATGQNQRVTIYGLTDEDLDRIQETVPDLRETVPVRELRYEVRYGKRMVRPRILGTLPNYFDVTGRRLDEGRLLCDDDHIDASNVCVMTSDIAKILFPFETSIGKIIKIGAEAFRVVGTIQPKTVNIGPAAAAKDVEGEVFVALRTVRRWFGSVTAKLRPGVREFELVELHQIVAQINDVENVEASAKAIREVVSRYHTDAKKDYEVVVPLELLQRARETKRIFNIVLGSIAGISLLVGGIGIMNVMLATVTERTREIGIRRALGAKRKHIILQFLVETVVLSACGGVLGVGLGIAIPGAVEKLANIKTIVTPAFPILAFGISVAVGIIFGIYPAWRAAMMDPVEALRHE